MTDHHHGLDPPLVLAIDPDPTGLKNIKAALEKSHYEAMTLDSPKEVINLLNKKPFDCIVLDAHIAGLSHLPLQNARELIQTVRKIPLYRLTPIILLAHRTHPEEVKQALASGATDFLVKPLDTILLLDKIELCLKNRYAKRQVYQLPLSPEQSTIRLAFEAKLLSISESDFTMESSVPISPHTEYEFQGGVFDEIGIPKPITKVISSRVISNRRYRTRLGFPGLPESLLKKIRAWLQKQSVTREDDSESD